MKSYAMHAVSEEAELTHWVANDRDWQNLVKSKLIIGMAKTLALHCALNHIEQIQIHGKVLTVFYLNTHAGFDHLIKTDYCHRIEAGVQQYFNNHDVSLVFNSKIENPIKAYPLTSTELITPEVASAYLKLNTCNRKIKPAVFKHYAKQMAAGEWQYTHQGIAFSEDNQLIDGQHRLTAIIESGVSIPMLVTRNLNANSFKVVDSLALRTAADKFRLDSRVARAISTTAAIIGKPKPTTAELEAINNVIGEKLQALIDYCDTNSQYFSKSPVRLMAICTAIMEGNNERAFLIYKNLVTANDEALSPISQSWRRQVKQNSIDSKNAKDILARAYLAFSPNNTQTTMTVNQGIKDKAKLLVAVVLKQKTS